MALFVKHLLDNVRDTLGGGDLPPDLDPIGIINQAGEHLHSVHPWRWAQGRTALLNLRGTLSGTAAAWTTATNTLTEAGEFTDYTFVEGDEIQITDGGSGATEGFYQVASRTSANAIVLSSSISGSNQTGIDWTLQPYSIDLPDDLRDIIAIVGTDTGRHVTLSGLDTVLQAREDSGTNDNHFYAAVSYVGTPPTPILEIAPGAGSNSTGAFRMFYRARWARLSSDNASVVVPEFCEALLLQLVRAFARGYVREDQSTLAERLADIEASSLFHSARSSDGNIQPFYGKLRGGGPTIWGGRRSTGFYETTSRINGPS